MLMIEYTIIVYFTINPFAYPTRSKFELFASNSSRSMVYVHNSANGKGSIAKLFQSLSSCNSLYNLLGCYRPKLQNPKESQKHISNLSLRAHKHGIRLALMIQSFLQPGGCIQIWNRKRKALTGQHALSAPVPAYASATTSP